MSGYLPNHFNLKMGNSVTSLQLKLILQQNKAISLAIIFVLILVIGIILAFSINSCGIDHIDITNTLKLYDKNLDPELCEDLVAKINTFNEQCSPYVEIVDCG